MKTVIHIILKSFEKVGICSIKFHSDWSTQLIVLGWLTNQRGLMKGTISEPNQQDMLNQSVLMHKSHQL